MKDNIVYLNNWDFFVVLYTLRRSGCKNFAIFPLSLALVPHYKPSGETFTPYYFIVLMKVGKNSRLGLEETIRVEFRIDEEILLSNLFRNNKILETHCHCFLGI